MPGKPPLQRKDFEGIFQAMDGLPVIIRLIDPPLHEFLPSHDELLAEVTEMHVLGKKGKKVKEAEEMLAAVESMREQNPMLGLRGIRLGITYPGILKMQVRAIFEAACNVQAKGHVVTPEVMIALAGHVNELKVSQGELEAIAKAVMAVKNGRAARPNLEVGICGEHGGDPSSIEFCHRAGLNYVSCSPFRVPVARLAAAQAALGAVVRDK